MNRIESKSILAKCLATEDISIVHDPKAPTAAFDVKARTLYLPLWKEMSPALYDLFIGHEVGHAHETPAEGWHDAVCDDKAKKNFLNVVEDVRIERKVKERYPGLVSRFFQGYQELVDGDFFGIKGIDINKLPLIDRVNLHYKVGHMMGVKFTTEEKDLVDRIAKAETWEDVERLANELFAANAKDVDEKKDELESMIEKMMPQRFKGDASDSASEDVDNGEAQAGDDEAKPDINEVESDSFGNPIDPDEYDREETEAEAEAREEAEREERAKKEEEEYQRWLKLTPEERQAEEDAKKAAAEQAKKDQELKEKLDDLQKALDNNESFSDNAFRDNEKTLVDQDAADLIYVKAPKLDPKDYIVPMNELYNWDLSIELQQASRDKDGHWTERNIPGHEVYDVATKIYEKWNRTQTPIINSMAQQFELRKAATAYKKSSIAKIGKLNEDKLWAYKLTEDLFQRALIVPDGKNHGILMFVDLSGSMYRNMSGTIDQMMNVAAFCRKVNIPFDVYGFSSAGNKGLTEEDRKNHWWTKQKEAIETLEDGQMIVDNSSFCLVHMLSSMCSKNEYINAMKYLSVMKCGFDHRRYYNDYGDNGECWGYIKNPHFALGSTPLNSAIIVGKEVAKIFRKRYNVEILSTIFLTDGGATDNLCYITRKGWDDKEVSARSKSIYDEKVAIKDGSATVVIEAKAERYSRNEFATPTLLEWYQQTTGSRMINFHIIEGKRNHFWKEWNKNVWMDGMDVDHYWSPSFEWCSNEWKDCLKNKFMIVEDKYGFDQRFLIKGRDDLKIETKELEVKSNKKGDLMRGFRNFNKGKTNQRLFLNKIIELVA